MISLIRPAGMLVLEALLTISLNFLSAEMGSEGSGNLEISASMLF